MNIKIMKDILQNFYLCGICGKTSYFSKKLKCQHSFCKDCLVNYISTYFGAASFPCPSCSYTHVPSEPETVIGQREILELEEDCLSRDLHRFYKDGEQSDEDNEVPGKDFIRKVACTVHPECLAQFYCKTCNTVVCETCRQETHAHCNAFSNIEESMTKGTYLQCLKVFGLIENAHSRTKLINEKLARKLDNLMPDDESVGKVVSYFSSLKESILNYLEVQEQKVLEKAKDVKKKETIRLQTDISVCDSVAKSLSQFENLIMQIQMHANVKPAQNMILARHLETSVRAYHDMLPPIETDSQKTFDVRFVINKELENAMVGADVVNIEVTGCSGERPNGNEEALLTSDAGNMASPMLPTSTRTSAAGQVTSTAVMEPSVSISSGEESLCQATAENRRVPSAPPETNLDPILPPDEEEPPPSYSSVVNQCFGHAMSYTQSGQRQIGPASYQQTFGATGFTSSASPSSAPSLSDGNYQLPSPHPNRAPTPQSSSLVEPRSAQARVQNDFQYPSSTPSSSPFAHLVANIPEKFRQPVIGIKAFTFRANIRTRLSQDKNQPHITGIARLNDCFVLLDEANNCLKVVNQNVVKTDVYAFEKRFHPCDIVAISDTECVVTAPEEESLLFLKYPGSPANVDPYLRKVIKAGPYHNIAYQKNNGLLIGVRAPPTCSARIDFFDMEDGCVRRHIKVPNSFALLRNITVTDNDFLVMCDMISKEVLYIENHRVSNPQIKRFTGSRLKQIRNPQGLVALPGRDVFLISDGSNGNMFMTSLSLTIRKVYEKAIEMYSPRKFTLSFTKDENILVVAYSHGLVRYYDIKSS